MAGDVAWLDVLPNMAKFGSLLTKSATVSARTAGAKAGVEFSSGLSKGGAVGAKALVDELTTASKKATAVVRAESTSISTARAREKDATAAVIKAEGTLAAARAKAGAESTEAAAAEAKLSAAMLRQEAASGKAEIALDSLKAAQAEARVTTGQLAEAQSALVAAEARASTGAARLSAAGAAGAGGLSRLGGAAKGALGTVGSLGAMFGAFELAKFGVESVKSATDFQSSMNLLVTAGGESRKALSSVSAGVESIAESTGTSLEQLSEGMYTVEKAGIRGSNGLLVLKASAQAAKAENSDLATVTNAVTSIMRSYDLPASQAVKVTNELVASSGRAKTTMQDYSSALSTVLPVASSAGLSFAQVGGAIATLTGHGTDAAEATQELANTIRNIQAPNNVAVKEMSKLGLSANDVSTQFGKKGLTGTIQEMIGAVAKNMGPSGLVIQKVLNQSKIAAQDASIAFNTLGPAAKKIASSYADGSLSLGDYRKALKALPGPQANLLSGWASLENRSKGFNSQLSSGVSSSQTATAALKQMLGGANGLSTALMLSGGSAKSFTANVDAVTEAGQKNGKNIETWKATSQTFKTQLSQLSQTVSVSGTQIATKLLPGFQKFVGGLLTGTTAAIHFASANKRWLEPLAIGIAATVILFKSMEKVQAAYTLALGVAKIAQVGFIAVTEGMTAAQEALDAAELANPLGLVVLLVAAIVAALAALVVGVIYAYNHFTIFRNIVNGVWTAIKIGAAAVWTALKVAFAFVVGAVQNTGKWFSWLWQTTVSVWDGIKSAFSTAWGGIKSAAAAGWSILKGIFAAIALGAQIMAAPYLWLWHNVISPVFVGIAAVVRWFYDAYVAVAYLIYTITRDVLGAVFSWLWKTIISPALTGIGAAFSWLWNSVISPVLNAINIATVTAGRAMNAALGATASFLRNVVGAAFSWFYNSVIMPVFHGISWLISTEVTGWRIILGAIGSFIRTNIAPVFTWLWHNVIEPAFSGISTYIGNVWTKGIKPIFDKISSVVKNDLPKAFGFAASAIGKAWDAVKSFVSAPIKWVVNTVIDDGLIGTFNKVASSLEGKNAKLIPKISLPKGFAGGGVIPGYQSAKRDDVLTPMRKGEGVLVPEVVRALGPSFVHMLNRAGNSGGVGAVKRAAGYASGGIVSGIKSAAGAVGGGLSSAFNWTKDAVGTATSIVTDPVGTIGKVISGLLGKIPGGPTVTALAGGLGNKVLGSAENALKGLAHLVSGGSQLSAGGTIANLKAGAGVAQWRPDVIKALAANGLSTSPELVAKVLRQITTESGGNPNAIQGNIGDINNRTGDLAKGLMQTISTTFNAYKFPGHGDIFNGYDNLLAALNYAKHNYGPNLDGLGEGHGYSEGGIVGMPQLLDSGGMLSPGVSVIAKKTREPEYALPESKLEKVVSNAQGAPSKHYEPHFHYEGPGEFDEREYMSAQHKIEVLTGSR